VLAAGFRPGNPDVALADPITVANGVDPAQPQTLLETPVGSVMDQLLTNWAQQRKGARVLLVLDVSGSMGDPADPADPSGPTKLDLAKQAVMDGLDEFKDSDLVGLRVFTTGADGGAANFRDLSPIEPIGANRERLRRAVESLVPLNGTPLYDVTQASYDEMLNSYDPALINAVVLLSDGVNDDGVSSDDSEQFKRLLTSIKDSSDGENSRPVRIFTVAYGEGADPAQLRQIAEASNATAYQATDATTINRVFTSVISNF